MFVRKPESLPERVRESTRFPIRAVRGLKFGLILDPPFPLPSILKGRRLVYQDDRGNIRGLRAVLNALERLASSYGSEILRVRLLRYRLKRFSLPLLDYGAGSRYQTSSPADTTRNAPSGRHTTIRSLGGLNA